MCQIVFSNLWFQMQINGVTIPKKFTVRGGLLHWVAAVRQPHPGLQAKILRRIHVTVAPTSSVNDQEPPIWLIKYLGYLSFPYYSCFNYISTCPCLLPASPHSTRLLICLLTHPPCYRQRISPETNMNTLCLCLNSHQWVLISWKAKLYSVT